MVAPRINTSDIFENIREQNNMNIVNIVPTLWGGMIDDDINAFHPSAADDLMLLPPQTYCTGLVSIRILSTFSGALQINAGRILDIHLPLLQ